MTKFKESIKHRATALFVIILLACSMIFTLTSCNSDKLERGDFDSDARYAAEILSMTDSGRLNFVKAERAGDIEEAKNVLASAIDEQKYSSTEDKEAAVSYKNSLTEESAKEIVSHLGTEYDLDQDAGFFDTILLWIGKALGWLTSVLGGSYVVAILLFAVFVEILMLPVAIKQQKNSIGMAKLRPQIARIEKKYAGRTDQATLRKKQEEIMELQQREGFSPFSGCLPLLVQLIIVGFILYPIIQNPLRYVLDTSSGFSQALISYATAPIEAGGLGYALSGKNNVIELLSMLNSENIKGIADFALISNGKECLDLFNSLDIPNFTLFGLEIGQVPKLKFTDITNLLLILVPLLNVALQWVSMKLMRKWSATGMPTGAQDAQAQASMKIMDLVMPLMTLFIMFQVPALIGIYWLFRSLLSLLKSYVMKIVMPVPKYTEAEIKEMEKAQKAAEKARKEALKEQPKFRSLHYIDEDDYDVLPEMKKNDQKKTKNTDLPDIKD